MQHDFQYVSREETKIVKNNLISIIEEVQRIVQNEYDMTLRYKFIGSSARDMITYDRNSNIGYDFDVDFIIDKSYRYTPKEIRKYICNALNLVVIKYHYKPCEDSTRVLTIKSVDTINSIIRYSCDFAIVRTRNDGSKEYIRHNKMSKNYTWERQPKGYPNLEWEIKLLERNKLWEQLRNYYLYKKNNNRDLNKKSRSIFAEAVHEMCQKNGYVD